MAKRWACLLLVIAPAVSNISAGTRQEIPPFQLADADGNGFVDQEEAARVGLGRSDFYETDRNDDARLVRWEYRALEARLQRQRRIARTFTQLDEDGDGVLSREEAARAVPSWEEADRNADGRIDRAEFAAFTERRRREPNVR